MKRTAMCCVGLLAFGFALFFAEDTLSARPRDSVIAPESAEVDGVRLLYLKARHGPAVLLLHGYTQTSRMWRPIMPLRKETFTAAAPDLPGIGDSEIPKSSFGKKLAAIRIDGLVRSFALPKFLQEIRVQPNCFVEFGF